MNIPTDKKVTDVAKTVSEIVYENKSYWLLLVSLAIIADILILWQFEEITSENLEWLIRFLVLPWLVLLIIHSRLKAKVRQEFWRQFAREHGWEYLENFDISDQKGVMFRPGVKEDLFARNLVKFSDKEGKTIKIFNYSFSVRVGRNSKTYPYTVFVFSVDGDFPHIYLDRLNNSYTIRPGEKVPLPGDFESKFSLFAPRKYEQEALEIFTPEVLNHLLEVDFPYDMELVDKEVIFYVDGFVDSRELLEKEFAQLAATFEIFEKNLRQRKFHPVGDMPHYL